MQIFNLPVISSSIAVYGRPAMHSPSSAAPAAATPAKSPWPYAMTAGAFGIGTTVISSSIAAFDRPTMPLPSSAAPTAATPTKRPWALYALTASAFGIGTTEFIIMGLLLQLAGDLQVSVAMGGLLISGYALGVFVGSPVLTAALSRVPRKTALLALMAIFTLGNIACALATDYWVLMVARVVTSLAHGTFFGVGAAVATSVMPADRKASTISTMFTRLTVATLLGVPAGAWLGLHCGARSTFWVVTAMGLLAMAVIALFVSAREAGADSAETMREEFKVLKRGLVLLGLGATVLFFAGVFTVFTFVAPAGA